MPDPDSPPGSCTWTTVKVRTTGVLEPIQLTFPSSVPNRLVASGPSTGARFALFAIEVKVSEVVSLLALKLADFTVSWMTTVCPAW